MANRKDQSNKAVAEPMETAGSDIESPVWEAEPGQASGQRDVPIQRDEAENTVEEPADRPGGMEQANPRTNSGLEKAERDESIPDSAGRLHVRYLIAFAFLLTAGIFIYIALFSPQVGGPEIIYSYFNFTQNSREAEPVMVAETSRAESGTVSEESTGDGLSGPGTEAEDAGGEDSQPEGENSGSANSYTEKVPFSVNINTASAELLASALPGVGEVTANAIVAYRESIGGFTSVEQLLDVKGIGQVKFEQMKDYVYIK